MKKTLIVIITTLVGIGLVGIAYYLLKKPVSDAGFQSQVIYPNGQTNTGQNELKISIPAQDGKLITVNSFIDNGVTVADPANQGTYYLMGSSGACKPDGSCPRAGTSASYSIVYFQNDHSFVVSLEDEPLGANRIAAEQYLMQKLGLSQAEMCDLTYSVMTTSYVSKTYGGSNLGFSFCPGAVKLP